MKTPDGVQQCYNAQIAVDAESQVIVAQEVTNVAPDSQRLLPMLKQIEENTGHHPNEFTADAGYSSEANFTHLAEAVIYAVIALRRYHPDEPPDADPAPKRSSSRWLHRNVMREWLTIARGKQTYKLRKQTVEPDRSNQREDSGSSEAREGGGGGGMEHPLHRPQPAQAAQGHVEANQRLRPGTGR